ncbi:MAG TPA: elongation factor G [Bryobacteraceae bacterium]|nr:elongation factor G [Bryobacteraceae bacterium]HOL70615.1 elongation factor G [Bryobacteraceae bacterium]HOQ46549.1 elongation factor G [Bryobacteraceae bacterium]HPQ14836.1 elongation factor G [Bryobacteraceae bacterium]HPU73340.1 elongation factor G [Bryobacteraceae bacterium]
MKVYEGKDIRNVGLVGHGHSGKTSLTAAFLYTTGQTSRLTRVDEGNTLTDFDDEEIQRKITISTAMAFVEWKKAKINLFDTPGFNIFINDTYAALSAVDSALVLVDGVAGVEVQTEKVWGFAAKYNLPAAFIINKLDRERASFERVLENIHENFGRTAVPIQLPIGVERDFQGVIDLVHMKAYTYEPGGDGKGKAQDIPANLSDAAQKAHEALVEMVAEGNDALMEEFFDKGTLTPEQLMEGLKLAVRERRLFPVMCAAALHNIGSDLIMDFVVDNFGAPVDRPPVKGKMGEQETERPISDSEPVSAFAFKTVADPFAGRITYFKVISGVLKNDANLVNARTGSAERLSHVGCPLGKTIQPVTELHAGDIGAVAKLKDTLTGDTLCEKGSVIQFPPVTLPEPSIAYAIEAKSRQDEDRMGNAIQRILEEDQSLRFYRDPQTKEFLLAGTGQQHVEVIVSRLRKRYNVDVTLKAPKIPYRETIRGTADVQGRHKKQTGGHGQFGDCWIKMEPLPRGAKFEFVNDIFGGAIPKQYIPAVEKGILEAAEKGYLAGYPVVDFKVTLYDGSYHEVDSSELSFKLAARKAFKAAMEQAKPALLEPVMNVEVQAPVEYAGDLMGDLNGRRGRISGMDTRGGTQIIRAQVPMAEMLNYQNDLTSMTQGRGSFTMEFSHYDFVPQAQAEKIIAAAKAAKAGEEEEEE